MRPHIPEEELHAYCDDELSPSQRGEIAAHLLGCLVCRAQHADVMELRARTVAILARAMPRTATAASVRMPSVRRFHVPVLGRRASIAAALFATAVGGGAWLAVRAHAGTDSSQLATTFVTPSIFAQLQAADSVSRDFGPADATRRAQMMAFITNGLKPHTTSAHGPLTVHAMATGDPALEVDPVEAAGWAATNWDSAMAITNGSLARLDGLPIKSIRLHPNGDGERPTIVVRQQLSDGRAVWVVEGPETQVGPVGQIFAASNVGMSMPLRTHPDYVKTADNQLHQSIRVITVAAYLPPDSLNALTAKLRGR
ncbi:MAG TPA: zf-HC2 domain-containing protein [Gemmatimonadales bacterium]|nr:zf-HC2 domain-containing protein [Gemmatimonadales bacterium]